MKASLPEAGGPTDIARQVIHIFFHCLYTSPATQLQGGEKKPAYSAHRFIGHFGRTEAPSSDKSLLEPDIGMCSASFKQERAIVLSKDRSDLYLFTPLRPRAWRWIKRAHKKRQTRCASLASFILRLAQKRRPPLPESGNAFIYAFFGLDVKARRVTFK